MKIPLVWGLGGRYPTTTASVKPAMSKVPVVGAFFLVDTGSPISFLSQADTLKIGRFVSALNFAQPQPVAGRMLKLAEMGKVDIRMKDEAGNPVRFSLENFKAAQPEFSEVMIGRFPSILGTDFLRKYRFKVCFDQDEPYLETSESPENP